MFCKKNKISSDKIKKLQSVANAVRYLSVSMVEKANSGHPGMPLGAADIVSVLFCEFLKFSTQNTKWINRDRFVVSAGHASAMLYSLLYLFNFDDIKIDDLKNFRQIHSKTAGHPEYGYLDGIESTTGPLGQGFATAVGMAIAQQKFQEEIGSDLFNNHTFVLVGDGCLQEGISFEAAELAGHLKLSKLIAIYDNNDITIDGKLSISCSSNTKIRFENHGWSVFECDGHNYNEIFKAITKAKKDTTKPSMIICKTKIGFGSSKEGSEEVHGSPLKGDDIDILKKKLNINYEKFEIPQDILNFCHSITKQNNDLYNTWTKLFHLHGKKDLIEKYFIKSIEITNDELCSIKDKHFNEKTSLATRNLSGQMLGFLQEKYNNVVVGSADLAKSNCVMTKYSQSINANSFKGNYINYGIREHAMGAIMNGLYLYGGLLSIGSTFLVFSDYMRASIRLSSLMHLGVIYVLTHDSISVGEDGPTHQPVEHIPSLRAIPNVNVFRPCDAIEVAECYQIALQNKNTPSAFVLSRQNIQMLRNQYEKTTNLSSKGAYIIKESENFEKDLYRIIASGAEVELACMVSNKLYEKGILSSVISVPCLEVFDKQSDEYKNTILGIDKNNSGGVKRIFIEAANLMSYYKYCNPFEDIIVEMSSFGLSGKDKDVMSYFGFTVNAIVDKVLKNK